MKVEDGKLIRMEYLLKEEDGDVIESSEKTGPIEYVHGSGKMLAGLESRIDGLKVGDEKEGIIPAKEAFGEIDDLPTKTINLQEFPGGVKLEKGSEFEASNAGGHPIRFVVVDFDDDNVTVRFTHPYAGKTITFKVKILDIREPGTPPPMPN